MIGEITKRDKEIAELKNCLKAQTEEIERLATMKDELTGQLEQLREKFSLPRIQVIDSVRS